MSLSRSAKESVLFFFFFITQCHLSRNHSEMRYQCCLNEASVENCIFPALLSSARIFVNKLLSFLDKKGIGLMACGLNRLELPVDFCNKIYAV